MQSEAATVTESLSVVVGKRGCANLSLINPQIALVNVGGLPVNKGKEKIKHFFFPIYSAAILHYSFDPHYTIIGAVMVRPLFIGCWLSIYFLVLNVKKQEISLFSSSKKSKAILDAYSFFTPLFACLC